MLLAVVEILCRAISSVSLEEIIFIPLKKHIPNPSLLIWYSFEYAYTCIKQAL